MTVGVAISSHKRPGVLARTLSYWALAMPSVLIVTHDIYGDGIAATKNRGIAALMDAIPRVEHLFLADDDVWPVVADPYTPYVTDPEPHLCHCWGKRKFLGDDGHYTTWAWANGVLLYVERRVIERVGGIRYDFGPTGPGEHREWSTRIHSAGFTRHMFADLSVARNNFWHALDRTSEVESIRMQSSTLSEERRKALKHHFMGSTDFVEYR